ITVGRPRRYPARRASIFRTVFGQRAVLLSAVSDRKRSAAMATLLLGHPSFADHRTAEGHLERPDRYRVVDAVLSQPQFDSLVREQAEPADLATTRYVHSHRYVDALEAIRPSQGRVYLDAGDTMMDPSTWDVVLRGVGGTLQAVDKILTGQAQNAFVACRPPGHHAETERAMGFCLFNNISIGARHAQRAHG